MELAKIVHILEDIAPPELAQDFDSGKIGLVVDLQNEINKVAVALDATEYVLKRASEIGADILITHHTPLFKPITSIKEPLTEILSISLKNNISIYVMHTNYDQAEGGVNDTLAKKIGLKHVQKLDMACIGTVPQCSTSTFAKHVAKSLDTPVQYVGERDDIVRVMTVAGSGFKSDILELAKMNSVDLIVSGELKHDVVRTRGNIDMIDATHYATENPAMEQLSSRLKELIEIDIEYIEHDPFIQVTE
ncbi:Nif3-like dinuclear metal center hexameric protein [Methanosalsum natronophilum]|uniref:Nif3-like dinuclear metal center hexameric protein n=1 Tax=Methanosalsum natronophilum TaxID=768733 RepID=A0A3R7X7U9_9EURY|nr:Nif3-like dinuclear metal center hexameric protein [Methanosalsum natronophilum]MCS3924601.1 dinuclear metal center YbgI/SA1388 family protein [Methanosalsum natronophilum]RQD91528.1 MAG: Nif3-like dinuclear metal center hexameric protein [Methanosalsum natronophilum]